MKKQAHPDAADSGTETAPDNTDSDLFQRSIGPVRPVQHDRVHLPVPRPPARARFRERDEQAVLKDMLSDHFDPGDYETGEELGFARPGLQHRTLKRLRRGQHAVQAECDLHGLTVVEARQALSAFLHECQARGLSCVRIIHGKGHGSHQRIPILKSKIGGWLRQRDEVLAFCSARPVDGGTGAVYVLLKKS
ncbi:MAG: Smr/MutS family protein [Gammaproteobacteria bacterium]|nr:Smr/MutS family protein [Gammaproteobacteria bacterium]MBU2478105.1 Smr/MutS family protein [Gammaproteobacteria bacterium]